MAYHRCTLVLARSSPLTLAYPLLTWFIRMLDSEMAKLTQSYLSKLNSDGCDRIVWDDALPGFGVRIKPLGAISFLVQYRNEGGRSRRYTLGRYGKLTADEARKAAKKVFANILGGADPAELKAAKRTAPTTGDLCDRYLADHAATHKKPSSVREDKRLINAVIKPAIGNLKTENVARADIAKLHNSKRATPYEANRALALLSKMFNLAELWSLRPDGSNPCRHIKRFQEQKRERFFNAGELKRIGAVLTAAEAENRFGICSLIAIRLLALTGCRVSEILSLRWESIDFEAGVIRLSDAKAGARDVALPTSAQVVLADVPRVGEFVVTGNDISRPLSSNTLSRVWAKIREAAEISDGRLHDFRHTVGTYGGQAGLNAFMVRDLLGHKTLAMTGRYVERDSDPMKKAADQVAGRIAAEMEGTESADIVPMLKNR